MNTKTFSLSAAFSFVAIFAVMGTSLAYSTGEVERINNSSNSTYHATPVLVTQDDGTQCLDAKATKQKIKSLKRQAKKDLRQKKKDARKQYRADMKEAKGDNDARKVLRKAYKQTRKDLRNEKRALRKIKTLAGYKAKGYLKEEGVEVCK